MALLNLAKQAISIGIKHQAHLGIGLTQRRGEQAFGKYQGVIGLIEQNRTTEDPLVLGSINRGRMLETHLGRRNIQAADPVTEGYPAGQGFLAELTLLLRQQRLPAVCHLWLQPCTRWLIGQIDLAQITDQRGVTRLTMQSIGEGRAAHDLITQHTVITGAYRFAQVQAQLLIAGQPYAMAEQFQIGAGGDALISLSKNLRAELHPFQQLSAVDTLARQVIEQTLQVGNGNRAARGYGVVHPVS